MKLKFLLATICGFTFTVQTNNVLANVVVPSNILSSEIKLALQADPLIQTLQLTSDQVKKWKILEKQFQDPAFPLLNDLKNLQQDLDTLLVDPLIPVGEIREKYRRVEIFRQTISRLDFEYRLGLRAILTSKQQVKFEDYMLRKSKLR